MLCNKPSNYNQSLSLQMNRIPDETIRDLLDLFFNYFTSIKFKEAEKILERIVNNSGINQIEFLWTILQPLSHRDFYYNGQSYYPGFNFAKLSTPFTRKSKKKRRYTSAYISQEKDAWLINNDYQDKDKICGPNQLQNSTLVKSRFPEICHDLKIDKKRLIFNSSPELVSFPTIIKKHEESSFFNKDLIKLTENDIKNLIESYGNELNDYEKTSFLRHMVIRLDSRFQYFLLTLIHAKKCRDFISLLPQNISLKILDYLAINDLLKAALVSTKWNKLCKSGILWKPRCLNQIKDLSSLVKEDRITDWKKIFKSIKILRKHWTCGNYKLTTYKGHLNEVLSVDVEGNQMASGSKDSKIKIWNLHDAKLKQTLVGHNRGVWSLKFITKYLLCSGSYDSTIKIWNLKEGLCSRTLYSHSGPVWSIVKCDYFLVSASQDRTAIVWDLNDCDIVNRLVGHRGAIFCVDAKDDLVVTGSSDKSIKIWNLYTSECLKSMQIDQFDAVSSISMRKNYIACTCKQKITIWKIGFSHNLELVREYKEHFKRIESIQILATNWEKNNLLLVSGGKDGLIKIWNANESKSVHTIDIHHSKPINFIYVDEYKIVTSSSDKSLKQLNFI